MSTLKRLLVAFGTIILIIAVQGMLLWSNLDKLATDSTLASTKPVMSVDEARAAWSSFLRASDYLANFLEMTRPENSQAALQTFDKLAKDLDTQLDRLGDAAVSQSSVQDATAVRADISHWIEEARTLLGASPARFIPSPHAMATDEDKIRKALDRLVRRSVDDAAGIRENIKSSVSATGRMGFAIVVIALIAGFVVAILSSLSVTIPIRKIGDVLRELANGNKSVSIPFTERPDDIGDTARAAQSFRDNIIQMEKLEFERREAEVKADRNIRYLAHHDVLTGLPNRAYFTEKLSEAVARLNRSRDTFVVFMIDLDGFKSVNDTLGHAAGDQLLRQVAQRLKSTLRETDVLARLGGDEFAVIQPGESAIQEAAEGLAVRIMQAISSPVEVDGNQVNVGASVGIALAIQRPTDGSELLKMADLALYEAKSSGRNNYRFFDAAMLQDINARRQLEEELRIGITRNELELHYQVLVDVETRLPSCFEALVRWRSPTRGLVMPNDFIPLAEETGLIAPIGAWVLQQACMDAATWPGHLKVAVNLSPAQLTQPDLLDVVLCALADSALPPERLELEITETALFKSDIDCIVLIKQLKQLGVSIALDDFGTGYSSLSYLTTIPFDKIKIDRSFISNMTTRPDCAAIVAAVLALGRSLNRETVAEGVETEQQFGLLRQAGLTMAQGYLFSRPLPMSCLEFNTAPAASFSASAA